MGPRHERGFTLIELVVLIVVLSALGMIGAPILKATYTCYVAERDALAVDSQAQVAMDRMAREIRMVDPATITTFTSSTLSFHANGSSVSYSRNAQGRLLRNSDVLAVGVSALTFSYLRQDGSQATLTSQIWKIQFGLQFSVAQLGTESLTTTVLLLPGAATR